MKRLVLAVSILTLAMTGCSAEDLAEFDEAVQEAEDAANVLEEQPGTITIEAAPDVCWSGHIGNSTKEGCGSKTFRITNEALIVANAQKQGENGKLTMVLEIGGKEVDRASTTAAYGIVSVEEG